MNMVFLDSFDIRNSVFNDNLKLKEIFDSRENFMKNIEPLLTRFGDFNE